MNNITSIVSKPACAPGTHASPDVISSEYDEYVVKKQLQLLKESEKWSRKELEKYQFERLKKLLIHAESNVPYYRKIFKDIGFRACSFNSLDEMKHIPMLSKETIIENIELFIDERADINSLVYMSTGGSTGNPLKVIMSREFRSKNHANTHYYMENLGFKVGGYRSVRLHGNRIPNTILSKGKYWVGEGNRLTM